jgi:hypothetical protein
MKSVTEFWSVNLNKGLKAKAELTAGGKTPEEIQTEIGTAFKMEGDKLKHFINAMEVASQNPDKLAQVLVVTVAEGETAPPKAVKIEETHYVPVFMAEARKVVTEKFDRNAASKGKKREGGPKSSPWGLTPEEKAAKKGGAKKETKPAT